MHEKNRYNEDGEKLINIDGVWVSEKYVMTDSEKKTNDNRFVKPKIQWWIIVGKLLCVFLVILLLFKVFYIFDIEKYTYIAWIGLFIYFVFSLKKIAIFSIKVYQRYAPDDIRKRCLYTPTCSQYTILSIQKYGFLRGIIKGINRIKRCKLPNGGEDYP